MISSKLSPELVEQKVQSDIGANSQPNDFHHTPDTTREEVKDRKEGCLLSILNLVIDFTMMPASPLEADEFNWRLDREKRKLLIDRDITESQQEVIEEEILVPVIRIFGPVALGKSFPRHNMDNCSDDSDKTLQSGCVHIHGAFPFLLARPVDAGPDGSSFFVKATKSFGSTNFSDQEKRIDWDDPDCVKQITEEIHWKLECALRSSVELSSEVPRDDVSSVPTRFIRQISVVCGRGFYTYSNGKSAPFLKVEYYDPSHRWRVKIMMERGFEMPLEYHPDTVDGSHSTETDLEVLKFRCYEAHIPYTMQFFKDYNLAGMAWMHLNDVRFRTPLPKVARSRKINARNNQYKNGITKDTVPDQFCWEINHVDNQNHPETCSDTENDGLIDKYWTRKETSADIEFDTMVQNILNVNDVITELSSDEDAHWRAVPSLREIWSEERHRMSTFLNSEDNFLNANDDESSQPFTLSVKKGADTSASRLALKGVKKLYDEVDSSLPDLNIAYRKTMCDILEKHKNTLSRVEHFLSRYDSKQDGFQSPKAQLTSQDEAVIALAALHDQFDSMNTPLSMKSISQVDISSQFSAARFNPMTQADMDDVEDNFAFALDMEMGRRIDHIEKDINPFTLTPYDDENVGGFHDEEECMEEEEFERYLTALQTQDIPSSAQFGESIKPRSAKSLNDEPDGLTKTSFLSYQEESTSSANSCHLGQHLHEGISPTYFQSSNFKSPQATSIDRDSTKILFSESSVSAASGSRDYFQPRRCPPVRGECMEQNVRWNSVTHHRDRSVDWLGYAGNNRSPSKSANQMTFIKTFIFTQSILKAPTTKSVSRWLRRQKNDKILQSLHHTTKNSKPMKKRHYPQNNLVFDDNSRKLTLNVEPSTKKRVLFADISGISTCSVGEVEEVKWIQSCANMSQDSSKGTNLSPNKIDSADNVTGKARVDTLNTELSGISMSSSRCDDSATCDPLQGIGNAGGRINVEGGGGLKAETRSEENSDLHELPSPELFILAIEVHVQCRKGKAGINDSTLISMKADPSRDPIFAVVYAYALDPGRGEKIKILERGCVFIPSRSELSSQNDASEVISKIGKTMGISSEMKLEAVSNEKSLLLRIAAIVRQKDPDVLTSWDTKNGGLGYLIDRGDAISEKEDGVKQKIDMVRLLGRTPNSDKATNASMYGYLFDTGGDTDASNIQTSKPIRFGSGLGSEWDDDVGAGVGPSSIVGRLILNGWKIISEEVKHPNSSYQPAMVSAILKRRIPFHDDLILTRWYSDDKGRLRWKVLKYRISQTVSTILLFDALDIIGRAGEAARLSGVELSQSFPGIRGSQYKVEGVLLRALKSLNSDEKGRRKGCHESGSPFIWSHKTQSQSPYKLLRGDTGKRNDSDEKNCHIGSRGYFFYSPSKADCSKQEALEAQALTLEPISGFYVDPIVVCDFTALYPSLIIAYNLCYSTCAGKLEYTSTRGEMKMKGSTTGRLGPFKYDEVQTSYVLKHHMKSLQYNFTDNYEDRCYCVPSGSIFVGESVVKGVLPRVLDEILSTRAMLKKAAKLYKRLMKKPPVAVLRQLEARQLALKYVANVTYGYTSATFSGRSAMPLLADAIVECGRRTLRNAIKLANDWGADKQGKWFGATVVYGDTDSIFIKLPGRSVREAFAFGEEYCAEVTKSNPPPVQLKLEKVYLGALLQTKKKYCGMKYESHDQKVPTFEAKGIETVRKDQCALTQKILLNALITIFQTQDIQRVKEYLCRQWSIIHTGCLPISDFILTGRVRSNYRGKIGPVQAALARRLAEADPGRSVQNRERLPYVIVASPGRSFKLRDCVLTPGELLLHWSSFTIHSQYYATKHVNAALNRCFSLPPYNVDINDWYDNAPKPMKRIHHWPVTRTGQSTMISTYFGSDTCVICHKKAKADGGSKVIVCQSCKSNLNSVSFLAIQNLNQIQYQSNQVSQICRNCNGCIENSGTFAAEEPVERKGPIGLDKAVQKDRFKIVSPMSTCTCIDCPVTYKRHELRESEVEALSLCRYLKLVED